MPDSQQEWKIYIQYYSMHLLTSYEEDILNIFLDLSSQERTWTKHVPSGSCAFESLSC
jgi:hypothetical protein